MYAGAVVTDLVEIHRLGTAKAAENLSFRRYLSAHHQPIEPLQNLAIQLESQIDCTACANCCRHSVVSVGHPEMEAIAGYLGEPYEDVVSHYTEPDPEAPAFRILRSNRDGCVFLDGSLCTIYEARPKACREFPHVTPGEHSLGARLSSLCRWAPLCPIVYNALEAYKHALGYRPPPGAPHCRH